VPLERPVVHGVEFRVETHGIDRRRERSEAFPFVRTHKEAGPHHIWLHLLDRGGTATWARLYAATLIEPDGTARSLDLAIRGVSPPGAWAPFDDIGTSSRAFASTTAAHSLPSTFVLVLDLGLQVDGSVRRSIVTIPIEMRDVASSGLGFPMS
jgi:hypothetical protein